MEGRLYLLIIRLDGIEPEIWRRFVVPGDITLDRLHDVIQIVMGYHEFLKVLKDPGHEAHESYMGWYSMHPGYHGIFDSERFDIDTVNFELLKYLRWSRPRAKFWHSGW